MKSQMQDTKQALDRQDKLVEVAKEKLVGGVGAYLLWLHSLPYNDKWMLMRELQRRTGRVGESREEKPKFDVGRSFFGRIWRSK